VILSAAEYPGSIPEMVRLFERSFGRPLPADQFEWRYVANPVGDVLAAVERDEDGALIGNYSASPCVLGVEGERVRTALSMNTMTDPAHAGKGIFTRLAEELYAHMAATGYELIWGFPNIQSHYAFMTKLAWRDIYEVPTLVLAEPKADGDVQRDDDFALDYGDGLLPDRPVQVAKDAAYLRWRYADHPVNTYANVVLAAGDRVEAHCVVKAYGNGLDLVDFRAPDADTGRALLEAVLAHAAATGATSVQAWLPRHDPVRAAFERRRFVNEAPITYFGGRSLVRGRLSELFGDFGRWYLQMGDSDVY
jgi:GNAT superfamily N-acetyltransferase